MSRVHVACATDRRYLPHCAAMLHSMVAACGGAVTAHVLHGPELRGGRLDRLAAMVEGGGGELRRHEIAAEAVADLPLHDRWTPAIWYRLLLPERLPDVERVLYVDADTLALNSPAPLFELDLAGHHVGAVTNVLERHRLGHPGELGLPGPRAYFNSGVLLMNLELMRHDDTAAQLMREARDRRGRLLWPDQDVLNLVLSPTRLELHPRWNRMHSLGFPWAADVHDPGELAEARAAPGILHFEGPAANKPWHLLAAPETQRLYDAHRRATPWPRGRRAGLSPGNVARWALRRRVSA